MNPQLQDLRDIHLPPPPSMWPLAPGWWLLIGLMVMLVVGAVWFYLHRREVNRLYAWRREALAEIAMLREQLASHQMATQPVLTQLSILIRRVAITQLPRQDVAALQGERWLAFLDLSLGEAFRAAGGALLITAPYQSKANAPTLSGESLQKLLTLVERWITRLEHRPQQHSSNNNLQRQAP